MRRRTAILFLMAASAVALASCSKQTYKEQCLAQEGVGDILYSYQVEIIAGNPNGRTISENCATRPTAGKLA